MKRTILWGGMALILLVLLAGAAYTAVRYATNQQNLASTADEPLVQISEEGAAVSFANRVIPAAELPEREADAWGIFIRRQDNALIIGSGPVHENVDMDDPERPIVVSHEGPEIEIVTSRDTLIYRDDTITAGKTGPVPQVIQQMDSLDEVDELAFISAWGARRGDRLVADLLVYSLER